MLFKNPKLAGLSILLLVVTACGGGSGSSGASNNDNSTSTPIETVPDNEQPIVKADSTYFVWVDEDITYAEGLSHGVGSTSSFAIPLKMDIYFPENNDTNRPVFMFIHGGGFTGGTKSKPEIIGMANYYASRGWVFVSIDYRTAEELITVQGMTEEQVLTFYQGIAPQEWIEHTIDGAETLDNFEQGIAMYAAQRDAKAALRWIVANANTYNINTDYITVGGASAGAITAITMGITELEDFRDEISIEEDPTLTTTNLSQGYEVKSMVYFWGSNIKLELFEAVYGLNRHDIYDPELFMAHGTDDVNPSTPFFEATELQGIYDSLGVYSELIPLEGEGHGAWQAEVDGKGLFELSFDFITARQELTVE